MADKKQSTELEPQSEEAREAALRRASPGKATATGVARTEHFGDDEPIEGEDRGSTVDIAGGEPKPDGAGQKAGKPKGLQAEEATYTTNGTVAAGMTSSPSGPVPLSAVVRTKEEAAERHNATLAEYERQLKRDEEDFAEVSEEQIERASAAELRAAAYDRGYDIGQPAGARATRARFRRAQAEAQGSAGGEAAGEGLSDGDRARGGTPPADT